MAPCQLAADSGIIFAANLQRRPGHAPSQRSEFATRRTRNHRHPWSALKGTALASDPATHELYVDTGGRIESSTPPATSSRTVAKGEISGSRGVAGQANNHHVYAINGSSGRRVRLRSPPIRTDRQPGVVHGVHEPATHTLERLPGHPGRSLRGLPLGGRRSPTTTTTSHLEVYRYDAEADGDRSAPPARRPMSPATGDASAPARPQPDRRRAGLLQHRRAAGPPRHRRQQGRLRVGGRGTSYADLRRDQPLRLRACSRSAPTARTPSSSPATLAPEDENGAADEDLRRPRRRRLLRRPGAAALRRLRRVPRAREPGRRAREHRHPGTAPKGTSRTEAAQGLQEGYVKKHGKCVKKQKKKQVARSTSVRARESTPMSRPTDRSPRSLLPPARSGAARRDGRRAKMTVDSFTTTQLRQPGRRPPRPDDLVHAGRTRGHRGGANVIFNAPRGPLRQPSAALRCTAVGLRPRGMPAELPGRRGHRLRQPQRRPGRAARHGAALRPRPAGRPDGALRLHRADLGIPIQIPVAVRTGSDYGLRFTVSESPRSYPLAAGQHSPSGASRRRPDTTRSASRKAPRANRPAARTRPTRAASAGVAAEHPEQTR